MSVRYLRYFLFAVLAFYTATTQAGWLCDFIDSIPRDTKRRNCWPKPFVCPDRQAARTIFALQVSNGWQRENTLGAQHFFDTNGQLNEAGKLKVRWILFEEPAQHRSVYVYVAQDEQETQKRIQAVQEYAAQLWPQRDMPMVAPTTIPDVSWPAERIEMIGKKYQASMPAPRLPSSSNQTGGGSGGSGTGM